LTTIQLYTERLVEISETVTIYKPS